MTQPTHRRVRGKNRFATVLARTEDGFVLYTATGVDPKTKETAPLGTSFRVRESLFDTQYRPVA